MIVEGTAAAGEGSYVRIINITGVTCVPIFSMIGTGERGLFKLNLGTSNCFMSQFCPLPPGNQL